MFDDNDVPYITDPVSFSHDREREDGFPLDPEALLAEVEAVAQERMIERCRNRKAKCDPNGTFQVNRKAAMKRRKRNRKLRAKRAAEGMQQFVKERLERRAIGRNERRAEMFMGSGWHDFWLRNGNTLVRKVEQVNGLKWQLGDRLAIQAGKPLMIDKMMDVLFMG